MPKTPNNARRGPRVRREDVTDTNAPAGSVHFADRLALAIDKAGSPACVGLDPVVERLPPAITKNAKFPGQADKIEAFCLGVIDACREAGIAAVKPQSACFERFGAAGTRALKVVIRAARQRGLMVVLDAKRGDIGVSAEHYAAAAFGAPGEPPAHAADALTVNAYPGFDTIEPYLAHKGRGVFVLVRTSNPGSDDVQAARLQDGRTVAEMMADSVAALGAGRRGERGLSDVGAVVGATKSADAAALRKRMPDTVLLVPGYGAQGGSIEDVRPMLRAGAASAGDLGVLVSAGRSVLYPDAGWGSDWRAAVGAAAAVFSGELRSLAPASDTGS